MFWIFLVPNISMDLSDPTLKDLETVVEGILIMFSTLDTTFRLNLNQDCFFLTSVTEDKVNILLKYILYAVCWKMALYWGVIVKPVFCNF